MPVQFHHLFIFFGWKNLKPNLIKLLTLWEGIQETVKNMSLVWLGSWYQSYFEFLSYHCLKTCLIGCSFSWCLSYFAQIYAFLDTERHAFSYRMLYALSWLLITICFSPVESAWGVYPSETDNFTVSFYCEKRAEARGEELGMELRSTWSDIF